MQQRQYQAAMMIERAPYFLLCLQCQHQFWKSYPRVLFSSWIQVRSAAHWKWANITKSLNNPLVKWYQHGETSIDPRIFTYRVWNFEAHSKTGQVTASEIHQQLLGLDIQRDLRSVQRTLDMLSQHFDIERDERSKPYGYRWCKHNHGFIYRNFRLVRRCCLT